MNDVLIEQQKEQHNHVVFQANNINCAITSTPSQPLDLNNNSKTSSKKNLVEQTKNQTLKALLTGPYHTIPKLPHQQTNKLNNHSSTHSECNNVTTIGEQANTTTTTTTTDTNMNKKTSPNKTQQSQAENMSIVKFNNMKNEIINLVKTNTISSFPVEENTSTVDVNKKLVHDLDKIDASLAQNMAQNIKYLENSFQKANAKTEIISNFIKLKNLAMEDSNKTSDCEIPATIRKLSMRQIGGPKIIDAEIISKMASGSENDVLTKKRLNLCSSIKSNNPKQSKNDAGTAVSGDEERGEGDNDDDDSDNDDDEIKENEFELFELAESIQIRKCRNEPLSYVAGKGRGKYECVKCNMRARKLSTIKKHMLSHTSYRPFICTWCKVSFKTKGNLVKHTKSSGHLRKCIELGMNPSDDEVTSITSKNIDDGLLARQLEIDKKIKVS